MRKKKSLLLKSLNPEYEPYEVQVNEVREVWKFCNYISSELPEPQQAKEELFLKVLKLEKDMKKIKGAMKWIENG